MSETPHFKTWRQFLTNNIAICDPSSAAQRELDILRFDYDALSHAYYQLLDRYAVHCQHDPMKPAPTLRPTYPRHDGHGAWIQEYRCNICQGRFELQMIIASAPTSPGDENV